MTKLLNFIVFVIIAILITHVPPVRSEFTCQEGIQESGSIYRICLPGPEDGSYNGKLVVWAHGFQDAGTPVEIPEDQLAFGDFSIPDAVTSLGFAFATNSYSKTGLAIVQGANDIVDLVEIFTELGEKPEKIFLIGASEGGIITTQLIEQYPDIFEAGLAICGPIGNFPFQINYFGNARATFQVLFPYLIPGDPFDPPQWIVDNWQSYYDTVVKPVVLSPANRGKLDQWVRVAELPFDEDNFLETVEVSVADVLRYSVVNFKDAEVTMGGFPFENRRKWYQGSKNDFLLNFFVPRFKADPVALAEMKANYSTTGDLNIPLITMHTLRDQQVPAIHETFYNLKSISKGSFLTKHINIPIDRFGHCNLTAQEALLGLGLMLLYAGDLDTLEGIDTILQEDELPEFENIASQYGLPYTIEGNALKILKE